MDNFNEINSYNSLTMSPNIQKESRSSTSYSLSKMKTGNEINEAMIKNEINSYKRVSIDLHSNNPQKSILNAEKLLTNIQNISTKDEDSSSSTFTKLPKIQKHLTSSSTLSGFKKIDSTNYFSKENNSSNSNILNQKDLSLINNNSIANSNLASRVFNSSKNTNKKRSHYMGSAHSIHSNHIYNQYNQLFSPPDPLLKRTVVPKVNPRFGKMKAHITLPEFGGEDAHGALGGRGIGQREIPHLGVDAGGLYDLARVVRHVQPGAVKPRRGVLARGDLAGATDASKKAGTWMWVSFGIGLALQLINVLFVLLAMPAVREAAEAAHGM